MTLQLRVGQKRAYLVQNGERVASFSADGLKWWREVFGDVYEIDDGWHNLDRIARAYLFARLYPYVSSPAKFARLLKDMDEFEAAYWMFAVRSRGMRGIAAFKKLFDI